MRAPLSMRSNVRAVLAAACLAVALVAVTGASCSRDEQPVGLGTARKASVTETVDAPATVTAKAVGVLTAPADGTLASLLATSGQQVAAGQVLAVVDSPTAQQRLAQATAALDALSGGGGGFGGADFTVVQHRTDTAARAAFTQARDAAGRIADPAVRDALLAQVTAAERSYQEAATTARSLVTAVQQGLAGVGQAVSALTAAQRTQAQAAYDLAKSTVDALTLRASLAGVVQLGGAAPAGGSGSAIGDLLAGAASGAGPAAAVAGAASGSGGTAGNGGPGTDPAVGVGSRVTAGTPVLTVVDTSELGLLAQVDETDVLLVRPGIEAEVELEAVRGARYRATVGAVDTLPVGAGGGGVAYRVRLALRDGQLPEGGAAPQPRPGMSAIARLVVRSATDAVTVPAAAVFNSGGRDAVWLVRRGRAVLTPVTIGVSGQDAVQITSGVADGDRVVVRGTDQVRSGQQVP